MSDSLLLFNRYKMLGMLDEGGTGTTCKVEDTTGEFGVCVVKIANRPTHEGSDDLQYEKEVSSLMKIRHSQVPKFYEYGVDEASGRPYIVEEFIDGTSLQSEISTHDGPFLEAEVKDFLLGILPVIESVHDRGLIHRDIKPGNIIFRGKELPVLVDFGAVTRASLSANKTVTTVGTFAYSAPEQVFGRPCYQSDLYSLGVIAIEMLTGIPPNQLYSANEGRHCWRDYLVENPVSEGFAAVLDRLIAPSVQSRFSTAREVIQSIGFFQNGSGNGLGRLELNPPIIYPCADFRLGKPQHLVSQTSKVLSPMLWLDEEHLLVAYENGAIGIWNVIKAGLVQVISTVNPEGGALMAKDGNLVVIARKSGRIELFRFTDGSLEVVKSEGLPLSSKKATESIAIHNDSDNRGLVVVIGQGNVSPRVFVAKPPAIVSGTFVFDEVRPNLSVNGHSEVVLWVGFTSDKRVVSVAAGYGIKWWRVEPTGGLSLLESKRVASPHNLNGPSQSLGGIRHGWTYSTDSNGKVFYSLSWLIVDSGESGTQWVHHSVSAICPVEKFGVHIVAGKNEGELFISDPKRYGDLSSLHCANGQLVSALSLSPSTRWLAAGENTGRVLVWSVI